MAANITSSQIVKNIQQNENACLSFINIRVQKGFQLKGKACIVGKTDNGFSVIEKRLTTHNKGKFPYFTITKITVYEVKPIIAPKYMLFPKTTEEEQIDSAKKHMVCNI